MQYHPDDEVGNRLEQEAQVRAVYQMAQLSGHELLLEVIPSRKLPQQPDTVLRVRETAWGPILHERPDGSGEALRWTAQLPGAVRLDFGDLARAGDLDSALQFADHAGIPAQNLVVGDRSGRIAWRLIGARPDRGPGCAPAGFTAANNHDCAPWPIRSDAAPSLIDPPSHRLWTANSRVVDEATLATVGNGGYDLGARGRQIRDLLATQEQFDEHDLLAIQLDDRAVFLQRWWVLLHEVVEHSDDPALKRLGTASSHWDGRAAIDSVSYRVVREFRTQVLDTLTDALLAPARAPLPWTNRPFSTGIGNTFATVRRLPMKATIRWPNSGNCRSS